MSASTRKKSTHRHEKRGRGLGYFGDDSDKIKELEERTLKEKSLKVGVNEKNTDANGRVIFTDLPIGQYVVEVKGNSEYQPSTKVINLVNEEDEDVVTVYVGIKKRIDIDVEIQFL
jgi:hypothetical protein